MTAIKNFYGVSINKLILSSCSLTKMFIIQYYAILCCCLYLGMNIISYDHNIQRMYVILKIVYRESL